MSTSHPAGAERSDLKDRLVADLRNAGCVYAEDEAEAALSALDTRGVSPGTPEGRAAIEDYVRRRSSGHPAEYILGSAALAGIRVQVGPGVFIPRPWSSDLVTRAAELLNASDEGSAVDIGTGSGAIALAIAQLAPRSRIWATDVDAAAMRWAEINCVDRPTVTVCLGDLYDALPHSLLGRVDVIAGSLPYVPTDEIAGLPRDHLSNEPLQAFDGGEQGLAIIARALAGASTWLRPGGHVLLEIGAGQGPTAASIAAKAGLTDIAIHSDDGGGELFLEAKL